MVNKNSLVKWFGWLVGLALIVLVVLGWMAYFSSRISTSLFTEISLVAVSVVLLTTYFQWVRARMATAFTITVFVMIIAVMWLHPPLPKKPQFQAVFLTNGQVYFGHLENADSKNMILTDIYYLQSTPQNPQQSNQNSQNNNLTLIKLGQELHGPDDRMVIKSDQVLFWEDLKDNGKVVQAIHQNQQSQ